MKIVLTDFAIARHFDPEKSGTIINITPQEFESVINRLRSKGLVRDGYADFCKLLFVKNWTNAKTGTLPIHCDNIELVRSGYKSRTENELPVLCRWIEVKQNNVPPADYLCIVLYSRDQLLKEGTDIGAADFGIVAILGQMHNNEEPMTPITMMRNALGIAEGGSGVPLNREAYNRSVEFWENHAVVKVE